MHCDQIFACTHFFHTRALSAELEVQACKQHTSHDAFEGDADRNHVDEQATMPVEIIAECVCSVYGGHPTCILFTCKGLTFEYCSKVVCNSLCVVCWFILITQTRDPGRKFAWSGPGNRRCVNLLHFDQHVRVKASWNAWQFELSMPSHCTHMLCHTTSPFAEATGTLTTLASKYFKRPRLVSSSCRTPLYSRARNCEMVWLVSILS